MKDLVTGGLRIERRDFGRERLQPLDIVDVGGNIFVDGGRLLLIEESLEPAGAVPLTLPAQHRLGHAGTPRFDGLPDREGHIGQEL